MQRILVDLDGICADLLRRVLGVIHRDWGVELRVEDITTFQVPNHVPGMSRSQFYKILNRPGFFDNLPLIDGALEAVHALRDGGRNEVLICSSPAGPDSARGKLTWCERHLGVPRKQVILTNRKTLIDADWIIDDRPETLEEWCNEGRCAATIAYPYNEHLKDVVDVFARDYASTRAAWEVILRGIL